MARRQPRLTKRARKAQASPSLEAGDRLRELASRHGMPNAKLHVGAIPGMPKMSDVIADWAAPLLEPLEDAPLSSFRNALSLAALIWNAATTPERTAAEVAAELVETIRGATGAVPDELGPIVEDLVASRRRDFAQDRRVVMAAEAHDHGDDRRINVVSAFTEPARASSS